MPELPEVETVKKKLNEHLKNRTIISLNVFHDNIFNNQDIKTIKKNIANERIHSINRRGKWLIFELDNYCLLSHLRMEGKYLYRNIGQKIEKHELVIFNINNDFELRYKDTRKFGKMYLVPKNEIDENQILLKLGLEPWDKKLNINYLKNKFKNKPIKGELLDQSIIAGIGNIYADEILFSSGIDPRRRATSLSNEELQRIIDNTRSILEKAIKNGGTTIRSYTSEEGVKGSFQNNLKVHQRKDQKCLVCGSKIEKIVVSQRGTYYCAECQK